MNTAESEIRNPADIDPSVKRSFFVRLAIGNKAFYQMHRNAGQTQRYRKIEGSSNLERWGDPTEHCLVEAAASKVFADMLGLSETDAQDLFTAAFIHDAGKRKEIEALQHAKAANPDITSEEIDRVNELASEQTKNDLALAGVNDNVIHLTSTVGHESLPQFVHLDDENVMHLRTDVPVVDMAMHYIDDITKGTNLVNFDDRIDMLEEVAAERYPYNEHGREIWGGRTYFEAQREAGHLVQTHLAEIAGVADPATLPDAINQGLVQLITNS